MVGCRLPPAIMAELGTQGIKKPPLVQDERSRTALEFGDKAVVLKLTFCEFANEDTITSPPVNILQSILFRIIRTLVNYTQFTIVSSMLDSYV